MLSNHSFEGEGGLSCEGFNIFFHDLDEKRIVRKVLENE